MEKRGSRYLRYALYNATKYVCLWDPTFAAYLAKKRAEAKHYNVAIFHAAKKLVRLIFAIKNLERLISYPPNFFPIARRGLLGPLLCYTLLNHLLFHRHSFFRA